MFSDCWNRFAIAGASSVAHSFKTLFGILSGPAALLVLIFFRRLSTPFSSIMMSSIGCSTVLLTGGRFVSGSLVKTELK